MKGTKSYIKSDISKVSPQNQLDAISLAFINSKNNKYSETEMEAKFGTRGVRRLTKLDYDNVVKKLYSLGFVPDNNEGAYTLKIDPEQLDIRTGTFKSSRIRIEIESIANIQKSITYFK